MAKISEIIVALIVMSLVAGGAVLFSTELRANYGAPDSFDNATLEQYDRLAELGNFTDALKNETDPQVESGITDIIGAFLGQGFKAIKFAGGTINFVSVVINSAVGDLQLGEFGPLLLVALSSIAVILFFFIIISILVKRES